jgi:hypothetical protein
VIIERIKTARRVSVPLVGVSSADQIATEDTLRRAVNGSAPLIHWDCVRGAMALNEAGELALSTACGGSDPGDVTVNAVDWLIACLRLPEKSIAIMANAHKAMERIEVIQALLNLRDKFKADSRMLILLAPGFSVPAELQNSIEIFDEPLPDRSAISSIVSDLLSGAGLSFNDGVLAAAADALVGLSSFAAEQSAAMAISKDGLSIAGCWERKTKAVEQTKGLKMFKSSFKFSDLGSLQSAKDNMARFFAGPCKPKVLVWADEIEKMMAGAGADGGAGDNTGVSQDFNGAILREMELNGWRGIILLGPPGAGKSAFAQALSGEFDCPEIMLDLGAMKTSALGESEQAIRGALKTIKAMGGADVFWVATCNKLAALPAEFKRRFRRGLWFFDLPDAAERQAIWNINLQRFGLSGPIPACEGWSGANIRDCCDIAYSDNLSVCEAASGIISAYNQDKKGVDALRRLANGCFLSASYPGAYKMPSSVAPAAAGRAFGLEAL